jgi:hypothetical protein
VFARCSTSGAAPEITYLLPFSVLAVREHMAWRRLHGIRRPSQVIA